MGKETNMIGEAVKKYRKLSSDYPEAKVALDLAPFSGVATSLADAGADAYEGAYDKAALDLLGVVPGAKLIKGAGTVKNAVKFGSSAANLSRNADQANDVTDYIEQKREQQVNKKAKGGLAKFFRGDGIAQRGKTKGRFV
jgi:hypothetical protein